MKFTVALSTLLVVASLASAAPASNQPKKGVYHKVFSGAACATDSPDYLTNSAQKTLQGCFDFCDSVKGCRFVNYYQDLASQKPGFGLVYTCSAYSKVHDLKTATNCGGQQQVGPFKNTIVDSSGYYKHVGLFGL